MWTRILVATGLIGAGWIAPLSGQSRLVLNIGGGITTTLNPTGAFTGVSGYFYVGPGYGLNKKNAITGECLWSRLPTDVTNIHPNECPTGSISVYSLTANWRHHIDSIKRSPLRLYSIVRGGWYYRYASIDKNYTVPP